MAGVVDGRCSVAGELKLTGQGLLTTHVYACICEHLGLVSTHTHTRTHRSVWLRVEHWAYCRPQLVVVEKSVISR